LSFDTSCYQDEDECGMIVTEEKRSTGRRTCRSSTLPSRYVTSICRGRMLTLEEDISATNHLLLCATSESADPGEHSAALFSVLSLRFVRKDLLVSTSIQIFG
jgi:hypothetical protein